jgi:hypothetical protein
VARPIAASFLTIAVAEAADTPMDAARAFVVAGPSSSRVCSR